MSSNVQANPLEESDQSTTQERSQTQAYQQDISQQDVGQINVLAQLFGTFILYKTDRFVKVKNAFNTIKDPKLAEKLLDFGNPQEMQVIRESLRVVDKKLRKQGVRQDKVGTGFLFWHTGITSTEFDRATRATAVARRVHHVVNNHSIQNQMDRLNLTPTDRIKFRTAIGNWLKEHPGQTIDNALIVETSRVYRERNVSFGKKEERELRVQLQKDRQQAIEQLKGTVIKRGEEVVKTILDPNQPVPTTSQTHRAIFYVETGQVMIDVTPPPIEPVTKPAVPATQITTPPQPPPAVPAAPIQPKAPIPQVAPSFIPSQSLLSKFLSRTSPGFSSIASRLGKVTSFFSGLGQKLFKNISTWGLKALGFAAKKIGLGAATGGVFTVIDTVNDIIKGLTGVDLEKFALLAALFVVGSIVGLLIFMIFFLTGGSSLFSPYTPNNPMIAKAPNSSSQTIDKAMVDKWKEFEKEYLNNSPIPLSGMETPADLSWEVFEKEYLTPQKIQLSFDQYQP